MPGMSTVAGKGPAPTGAPLRLAVLGLGLIGGSLARALTAAGAVSQVTGFDPDPVQGATALALGVVHAVAGSVTEAARGADVVVLAAPVMQTRGLLAELAPMLTPGMVLTDVGSTKSSVLADALAVFGAPPPNFVAAHPIAGGEHSGVANSRADLFHGHRVIVCPHPGQAAAALALIDSLWRAAGAHVVQMDPVRHDAIFAATSHLPHLLAYGFVGTLADLPEADEIFPHAGGGFKSFTRIASSSPRMWRDILRANREPVLALLDEHIETLKALRDDMVDDRWDSFEHRLATAKAARDRHLSKIE